MEGKLVTIYTKGGFGSVIKIEAKLVGYGTREYAQYTNAPFVKYIPKGKRKVTGFIQGYKPFILILDGHNHPEPEDMFIKVKSNKDISLSISRYVSFDERYLTDFNRDISSYLSKLDNKKIIFDVRF